MRILDLAIKDLLQLMRDHRSVAFLLIMPIAFTWLIGLVTGGIQAPSDPRLVVGYLDQDQGKLSPYLLGLIENSEAIRPEIGEDINQLRKQISDKKYSAAVIIPAGYSQQVLDGKPAEITLILDSGANTGNTVQSEIQSASNRLLSAARIAHLNVQMLEAQKPFPNEEARAAHLDKVLGAAIAAWDQPPVTMKISQTGEENQVKTSSFSHSSPGMMVQFAIVGLMGAASIIVVERKTRSMQRLLTTPIRRYEIIAGHFLAMFVMILIQLLVLILLGQFVFKLDYFGEPLALAMMVISAALMSASMGLLIGTLAKTEEQVIVLTLIPMFVLSGLGGAWVPLEVTSPLVQSVAHFTPTAWMMDGFKGILILGSGWRETLLPAGVLIGFFLLFTGLAAWRFKYES